VRGSNETTHRFRPWKLAVGAAGIATALACASPPPPAPGPTYQDEVSRWYGEKEVDLVTSWGMPQKTHVLADGGRIIEYRSTGEDESSCTTRFTLDRAGKIVRSWYTGVRCAVPKSG
jgi:hypothetical protein